MKATLSIVHRRSPKFFPFVMSFFLDLWKLLDIGAPKQGDEYYGMRAADYYVSEKALDILLDALWARMFSDRALKTSLPPRIFEHLKPEPRSIPLTELSPIISPYSPHYFPVSPAGTPAS